MRKFYGTHEGEWEREGRNNVGDSLRTLLNVDNIESIEKSITQMV